jgi:hypothetical protein
MCNCEMMEETGGQDGGYVKITREVIRRLQVCHEDMTVEYKDCKVSLFCPCRYQRVILTYSSERTTALDACSEENPCYPGPGNAKGFVWPRETHACEHEALIQARYLYLSLQ